MLKRLVLVSLLGLLAACDTVDPNSPLGKRKAVFQQMMDLSEDLGGMMRGRIAYDEQEFAQMAAQLDEVSRLPWQYFEQDDETGKSGARDDVWEQKQRFMQLARELEAATARLVENTTGQPVEWEVISKEVDKVEQACESCHQEFRVF